MAPINKVQDLFNVREQVVVITGGGSGLGLYAARALEANGAKAVYIVGRREEVLRKAAATAEHGRIIPIVGDVTSKESLLKIVEQVKQEQGYINLLFANAGIIGPEDSKDVPKQPTVKQFSEALFKTDMEAFTNTARVNSTATYFTVLAFLELLDAGNKKGNVSQDSQIIITSSIAGFSRQPATSFAYTASKAAATHLAKALSTTFAQNAFHIRVNVIAPGFYPSEMTGNVMENAEMFSGVKDHPNAYEGALILAPERCPAGRSGSEQDFAGTILFLASSAGAYMNGETLVTDGGRIAQLPSSY